MDPLVQFLFRSDTGYFAHTALAEGSQTAILDLSEAGLVSPLPGRGSTGHMAGSNLHGTGTYNSPLGRPGTTVIHIPSVYVGHRGPLRPTDIAAFLPLFH